MGTSWNFGMEPNFSGLIWYLLSKLYRNYELPTLYSYFKNSQGIVGSLFDVITPIGFLLALIGGYRIYRFKNEKKYLVQILLSIALSFVPIITRTNFSSTNPDISGYLLPSFLLSAYLAFEGITWLTSLFPKLTKLGVIVGYISILIFLFLKQNINSDFSGLYHLRNLEEEPNSLAEMEISSFHTFSFLKYGQILEGVRPDVTMIYRGLPVKKQSFQVRYSTPILRPKYWELAMDALPQGGFSLKNEDLLLAPHLKSTGWFNQRDGGQFNLDKIDLHERYIHQILNTMQQGEIAPEPYLEPILFNQVNHYLLALHQKDGANRAEEIKKGIMQTFPDFDEFAELK
jgi:hypothetical protein